MFDDPKGPIEKFSWGKYIIRGEEHSQDESGRVGAGKDIRMIGKKVSRWKERKGHLLTEDMITGVLDENVKILVLGIGVDSAVEAPKKLIEWIKDQGIKKVIVLDTPAALRKYNELYRDKEKVALLAHGTC